MDSEPKQLLLIEDDTLIRELYKRQLDKAGLPTDAFDNGPDGIAAAQNKRYDLVLLDIMLPQMNGLDILRALKKSEKSASIPVIFLTNMGQESILQEGISLGAIGYLIKASYTPDQLIEEIKNVLAKL